MIACGSRVDPKPGRAGPMQGVRRCMLKLLAKNPILEKKAYELRAKIEWR